MNNNHTILANALKENHYLNGNGCLVTDYHKIKGLKVLASTTNGTSGIGMYRKEKLYWFLSHVTQVFEIEKCPNIS